MSELHDKVLDLPASFSGRSSSLLTRVSLALCSIPGHTSGALKACGFCYSCGCGPRFGN